ncbi:MAG: Gar1/Naf1 family protein [Thermofilaceae archaeon]|jgi:RNA-binding protein|nr:Gar1/Naf1 family protein [Thermofilum sp.]MCC6058663.1 Gar1/Naf1 family protein [Thermofilum sp.]
MRALGRVRLVSRHGNLVVEAREVPEIGEKVYDDRMTLVGYVYDVVGPVRSPFVLVKVDTSRWRPEALVGKLLYWQGPRRREKRKKA